MGRVPAPASAPPVPPPRSCRRFTGWWWWTRATWSRASSLSRTSCKPWSSRRAPEAGGGGAPRGADPPSSPATLCPHPRAGGDARAGAPTHQQRPAIIPSRGAAPALAWGGKNPQLTPHRHTRRWGGTLRPPPTPRRQGAELGSGRALPFRDPHPLLPPPQGSVLITLPRLRPAWGCPPPQPCAPPGHPPTLPGRATASCVRINTDLARIRPRRGARGGHQPPVSREGGPREGVHPPPPAPHQARGNLLSSPRPKIPVCSARGFSKRPRLGPGTGGPARW